MLNEILDFVSKFWPDMLFGGIAGIFIGVYLQRREDMRK